MRSTARQWGPAVWHIRSHKGFIERLAAGGASITAMHDLLAEVLDALVQQGKATLDDRTFAVLLWITIFDERVVYDLGAHQHWSAEQITDRLTRAAARALGIRV